MPPTEPSQRAKRAYTSLRMYYLTKRRNKRRNRLIWAGEDQVRNKSIARAAYRGVTKAALARGHNLSPTMIDVILMKIAGSAYVALTSEDQALAKHMQDSGNRIVTMLDDAIDQDRQLHGKQ